MNACSTLAEPPRAHCFRAVQASRPLPSHTNFTRNYSFPTRSASATAGN